MKDDRYNLSPIEIACAHRNAVVYYMQFYNKIKNDLKYNLSSIEYLSNIEINEDTILQLPPFFENILIGIFNSYSDVNGIMTLLKNKETILLSNRKEMIGWMDFDEFAEKNPSQKTKFTLGGLGIFYRENELQ